ncbi:MAG TPA: tRNA (N(6)-L-threonylcarbamoyladenosine(37)-C(2))-methylthiotransferase MtaB [Syntrophomonas sp.]|nr:tRNA (N(6)-L-threonylcarbamoyladenosine(37)-C(2))-methylthiotransferase MtaB [Syntrophomonas sp.]
MRTVAFNTLGCKVNQVETEQIKEDFIRRGYKLVDFNQTADVYVINTCTVTHVSDRKSRTALHRAVRQNPAAVVVVTGCLAQINSEEIAGMDNVTLVVGNSKKDLIAQTVDELDGKPDRPIILADPIKPEDRPQMGLYTLHHKRTRGFVKIEDGCENFCSYCIVPLTRGPVRSKLPEEVRGEIENMVRLGYKEIVLTGIHTGLYGKDLAGWNLESLLYNIIQTIEGEYRLRLSSIEPLELSPGIIELAAGDEHFCRHFHIPLQSGSDPILRAMGRKYDSQYYRDLLLDISAKIPGVALTTDVMTGFPGESEENFNDTFKLLNELPIYNMHVFKYSRRVGTPAAVMEGQVPEVVKQERSARLLNLAEQKRRAFVESQQDKVLTILVERKSKNGMLCGITDNYINVLFSAGHIKPGQFAGVRIKSFDDMATGELIDNI